MKQSIYIVNPIMTYQDFPLPYLYLIFKSYHKEFGKHPDAWSWPLPVNGVEGLTFDDILGNVLVESPKVVGFSSYVWNYKLNLELGKAIKELLPDCILVYDGPEVPYDQHPNWLKENYFVDLIADSKGTGEEFMMTLLDQLAEGSFNPARYTHYNTLRQLTKSEYYLLDDPKYQGYFDLVIATSTYTKQEWLQMYFMDNFVRGVECLSVTTSLREHCETLGVSAGQFFRYCWATLEKMRASGNEGLAEIFSSIEDALQGKITFVYYQYQGQILGLQTISSFFLTKYADEFVSIFREFLPQDAEVDHQIGKMKSRLETLKNNADPVRRIVDEHSSYVYGSLSKKINSTSALKAVGNGIE